MNMAVASFTRFRPALTGMTGGELWAAVKDRFPHRQYVYSVLKRLKKKGDATQKRKKFIITAKAEKVNPTNHSMKTSAVEATWRETSTAGFGHERGCEFNSRRPPFRCLALDFNIDGALQKARTFDVAFRTTA